MVSDPLPPDAAAIVRCSCGATHRRFRHQLPERHRWRYPPDGVVWAVPKMDPCDQCVGIADDRRDAAILERRQASAGLGERDRVWRFDRAAMVQGAAEDPTAARRKAGQGVLVVDDRNRAAFNVLNTWRPTFGKCWIYLEGEPGTGKTAFAAALVTRLISVGEEHWQWRDPFDDIDPDRWSNFPEGSTMQDVHNAGRQGFRTRLERESSPLAGVVMVDEQELWARTQLSWTRDKDPLGQVEQAQVLVLDDLGAVSARKGRDKAVEMIEKLIPARYKDNAPTVITSNVPFSQLGDWYGHRVASRIEDITPKANRLTLATRWRAA